MPKGQKSVERLNVNPTDYKNYFDLPLVNSGCDSYASWDKRFRHLSELLTLEEIVERVKNISVKTLNTEREHIILTGGEPLLARNQAFLPELIKMLDREGFRRFTFETNGTQALTQSMYSFLLALKETPLSPTFSISAKLPVSGEPWEKAIRPNVVREYTSVMNPNSFFKFVCQQESDFDDVDKAVLEYRQACIYLPVYIMPEGGTYENYMVHEKNIALMALDRGYRVSLRLQNILFKNAWGT